ARIKGWSSAEVRRDQVQGSQCHRARLCPFEAVARTGHSLRQTRRRLSSRCRAQRCHCLVTAFIRHALVREALPRQLLRRGCKAGSVNRCFCHHRRLPVPRVESAAGSLRRPTERGLEQSGVSSYVTCFLGTLVEWAAVSFFGPLHNSSHVCDVLTKFVSRFKDRREVQIIKTVNDQITFKCFLNTGLQRRYQFIIHAVGAHDSKIEVLTHVVT